MGGGITDNRSLRVPPLRQKPRGGGAGDALSGRISIVCISVFPIYKCIAVAGGLLGGERGAFAPPGGLGGGDIGRGVAVSVIAYGQRALEVHRDGVAHAVGDNKGHRVGVFEGNRIAPGIQNLGFIPVVGDGDGVIRRILRALVLDAVQRGRHVGEVNAFLRIGIGVVRAAVLCAAGSAEIAVLRGRSGIGDFIQSAEFAGVKILARRDHIHIDLCAGVSAIFSSYVEVAVIPVDQRCGRAQDRPRAESGHGILIIVNAGQKRIGLALGELLCFLKAVVNEGFSAAVHFFQSYGRGRVRRIGGKPAAPKRRVHKLRKHRDKTQHRRQQPLPCSPIYILRHSFRSPSDKPGCSTVPRKSGLFFSQQEPHGKLLPSGFILYM